MRKHWVALLSIAGLTGSSIPGESQVLKGSETKTESKTNEKSKGKTKSGKDKKGKLGVKQQTVRKQNQPGGDTAITKGKAGNQQLTK